MEGYLHRRYARVDGLWFVPTEQQYGFEAALALDSDETGQTAASGLNRLKRKLSQNR